MFNLGDIVRFLDLQRGISITGQVIKLDDKNNGAQVLVQTLFGTEVHIVAQTFLTFLKVGEIAIPKVIDKGGRL